MQRRLLDKASVLDVKASAAVWLDADCMSADSLWARVHQALTEGQRVWLGGALFSQLAQRSGVEYEGQMWLTLAPRHAPSMTLLRGRDLLLAGTALIVLSPLFLVLALLVKRSSPGPIFYATEVVGKHQTRFVWRKFRSMLVLGSEEDEATRGERFRAHVQSKEQGKLVDEVRVTRIGKFMRKYSLDELPQLWNVLVGEMTLVGPRPCLPYEKEFFPRWAQRRFDITPGLTGMWQVFGRSRTGLEEGLAMDVHYSYARSFWMDLRLMLSTITVMLEGTGGR